MLARTRILDSCACFTVTVQSSYWWLVWCLPVCLRSRSQPSDGAGRVSGAALGVSFHRVFEPLCFGFFCSLLGARAALCRVWTSSQLGLKGTGAPSRRRRSITVTSWLTWVEPAHPPDRANRHLKGQSCDVNVHTQVLSATWLTCLCVYHYLFAPKHCM